jgi:hypothetical protein
VTGSASFPPGPRRQVTPIAAQLIERDARERIALLAREAELIAFQYGDHEVNESHVAEARRRLEQRRRSSRGREFMLFLGAGAFGAGVQGFLAEIFAPGPSPVLLALWVGCLVVGLGTRAFIADRQE